ncbi:MAG TPA: FAD-dependent oxidoreductase, partial [Chloroflexi bacterium]|nr:FAD-dependent oxidoreductase [Chloroflexota bacterium]
MAEKKIAGKKALPEKARVVIIGGGVIGCSTAYHLAKSGWKDILLLERAQLTSGTTWHAAGLIEANGFFSATDVDMAQYTLELYESLERETGMATGHKGVGMMTLASTPDRVEEMRRIAAFNRYLGVEVEELTPQQIKEIWPLAETKDVLAGFLAPGDGRVNPVDVTMALAKGARNGGVQIFEDTPVTGFEKDGHKVTKVITNKGDIEAEYVVNCAGMWANEVGKMAGVNVPLQPTEHYYLITEAIEGVDADLPVLVDMDKYAYYREEVGGILFGIFEPVSAPWAENGIPKDFIFGEINPDWDRMMPYIEDAMKRIPVLENAGIHKFFCGPESFTPDISPMMGLAPELDNYYVAAGFNSLGILLGGGAGRVMAQWIVDGVPDVDVTEIDIARMLPFENTPSYRSDRAIEVLGVMFEDGYPNKQFQRARNARKSAFHDRLADAGAYFGVYAGWEYPDWFAPKGVEPKVEYSWGRQNWFEYSAAEHKAARESVSLLDYSVMGKILVQGKDAEKYLNLISANNVAVPTGRCVYTQWLNETGTIEADLTITRLAEDRFLILSGDRTITAVHAWLRRHIPPEAHVYATNITSAYSVLSLQGPKSRDLLSRLTHADVSHEAFPFLTMQEIDIGYALVKAIRISYVGELGWELYIPTEFSLHVFDRLVEAGKEYGLKHIGLQALESLRLEKAYRDFGSDIDNTDTPLETGLGHFVKFDKPGGFIGRDALLRLKERGYSYMMPQFLLKDPDPMMYYGEIIYRNGVAVGNIMAGAYGHTLGAAVGVGPVENEGGIVTPEFVMSGSYEIDIAGVRYPAEVSLKPMYDPG